ncbi:MAG: ETC complex I subunit [Parvibaculum sp.]
MLARIYKPAKTAMQSGRAKTHNWILEFEAAQARAIEPLMGYTGTSDMASQIVMKFETKEQAVAYAQTNGIDYQVVEPARKRKAQPKAYADNFKFGRIGQWTH